MPRRKKAEDETLDWWSLASTQAQRTLLKALGVQEVAGLTRGEASDLIDERRPGRPPFSWLDLDMDLFLKQPYT
jgi:hypothetical protein